nr:germin-like protein subfamily 1 member 13 [Ipomoea batatas]
MALRLLLVTIAIMALASSFANASDPSPLQDFCVAINDPKDACWKHVQSASKVTAVNVDNLAGLNTLGISLARIDFAPYGLNPPHTHPRATEVLAVLEGTLYVGFVLSNPPPGMKNKLFTKTLYPGDVFVFPEGLIHFQFNVGKTNAIAFAGLSSQNPGVITIVNAVFGSDPPINPDVLTKAFQVDDKVIKYLQSQFWYDNN